MLVLVSVLRLEPVLGIVSVPVSVLVLLLRFGFGVRFGYGTLTATTVRNDAFG